MGILYAMQPEELEPVDFTHYDQWEDDTTWAEIVKAWSENLGVKLPDTDQDATILALLRKGFDVYEGEEFIEIYEPKSWRGEL